MNRQESFQAEIKKFINGLNQLEPKYYDYRIDTIYGALEISLHESDCVKPLSKLYNVFCRFENPKAPEDYINCIAPLNRYSGKWNFHISNKAEAIKSFKNHITLIYKG